MKRKRKKYTGVRQRGNDSYEINYYVNGKRIVENIKASSQADAFTVRLKRLANVETQTRITNEIPLVTLEQAFERYIVHVTKTLHENTRQRSRCVYNLFTDFLRDKFPEIVYVHQVTGDIAMKYLEHLHMKKNKSASGINTDIDKLRAIFKKYKELKIVFGEPFYAIQKIPRRLAKPKKKYLPTDYEIFRILEFSSDDISYREITRFLVRTGRRIEESCLYRKEDVVVDSNGSPIKIVVRPEISKTKETGEVTLDEELSGIVKEALCKNPSVQYLFSNIDKRKIAQNTYRDYLGRLCNYEKLKRITPHCFRYYVCNKLLNSGVNIKDAMAITGHTDVESFMSYIKTTEKGRLYALSVTRLNKIK